MALDTGWKTLELRCTPSDTDPTATVRFMFGGQTGTVWIDDVGFRKGARPEVWRRDFAGGVALVNPTSAAVTVDLGGTFRKIKGIQAPSVNDSGLVRTVTLQAQDGLVLLR